MPRYIVQRPFPEGLHLPAAGGGADLCREVIEHNAQDSTTWISSFVTEDKTRTFCVYDAPAPEAVRSAAVRSGLPVDEISQVRVLDPYFCT